MIKEKLEEILEDFNIDDICEHCCCSDDIQGCSLSSACDGYYNAYKLYTEMVEIKNKLENRMLIELPCKVGDTVYILTVHDYIRNSENKLKAVFDVEENIVDTIIYKIENCDVKWIVNDRLLNTMCFLTKEQAEAKLKELQNKE